MNQRIDCRRMYVSGHFHFIDPRNPVRFFIQSKEVVSVLRKRGQVYKRLGPVHSFLSVSAGRDGHGGFAIAGVRRWIAEQVPDAALLFRLGVRPTVQLEKAAEVQRIMAKPELPALRQPRPSFCMTQCKNAHAVRHSLQIFNAHISQADRIICTAASLSILPTGDTFPSFSLRTIRSICTMAPRCQLSTAEF